MEVGATVDVMIVVGTSAWLRVVTTLELTVCVFSTVPTWMVRRTRVEPSPSVWPNNVVSRPSPRLAAQSNVDYQLCYVLRKINNGSLRTAKPL